MVESNTARLTFGTPGSGKTSSIVSKLRALASDGVDPRRVLVIVPNRNSANLLRDRVLHETNWVSNSDIVRTLQSVAFEICTAHAVVMQAPKPRLLTGAAQAALLRRILESEFGHSLRGEWSLPSATLQLPSFYAELRDLIAVCQQHETEPAEIIEIGRKGGRGAIVAAGRLLGEYRRILDDEALIDAQRLISVAERVAIERRELMPRLSHLFIDDSQEFSVSELRLLSLIGGTSEIEAYADPDATVLGFRAAAPEEMQRILSQGKCILRAELLANQQRPEALALALDRISQRIPTALGGTHRATLKHRHSPSTSAVLSVQTFDSVAAEGDYIADLIRKIRVSRGSTWSDFAVVVRTRAQIDQLSHSLSQHGIPVRVPSAQAALSSFGVAQHVINLILRAQSVDHLDRTSLGQLLDSRLSQLDSIDVRSLKRRMGVEPQGLVEAFQGLLFNDDYDDLKGLAFTKARGYGALIRLAATAAEKRPHQLISEIWTHLDLAQQLQQDAMALSEVGFAAQRDLDSMVELVNAAIRFSEQNPDGSALDFAHHQSQLLVAEDSLSMASRLAAVQILTPAGVMGQRFPVVILPRLQEGIWPNLRPRNSLMAAASIEAYFRGASDNPLAPTRSELQHELRSFYKALGSATEQAHLTAVQQEDESPSQFLSLIGIELPEPRSYRRQHDLRARVATARREFAKDRSIASAAKLAAYAKLGAPGAHPQLWYGSKAYSTLQPIARPEGGPTVSPSQLEKFSKCPLHWFISTYGGEGKGFEASVGTLLHEALEVGGSTFEQLWAVVESKWGQLNSTSEWQNLAERRKAVKMVEAIARYLSEIEDAGITSLEREKFISARLHDLEVRGTIDRIERLPDDSLRIVDLKTGFVGTKAEVAQNLQLAVYQLLAELAFPEKAISGALIVGVKGGKLTQSEQPPLTDSFRAEIEALFERARQEFPGPSFQAALSDHCGSPGSICSILIAPEVSSN